MPIRIVEKDITTIPVDMIANTISVYGFAHRALAKRILSVGGPGLEREVERERAGVRFNEYFLTDPYLLSNTCKKIMHLCTFDSNGPPQLHFIHAFYKTILEIAEVHRFSRIAVPLFAPAPPHRAVHSFIELVKVVEKASKRWECDVAVATFASATNGVNIAELQSYIPTHAPRQQQVQMFEPIEVKCPTNGINLRVVCDDLFAVRADVLVTQISLPPDPLNALAEAVIAQAGPAVGRVIDAASGTATHASVVSTGAGKMHYMQLIHAFFKTSSITTADLNEAYGQIFQLSAAARANSIVIPLFTAPKDDPTASAKSLSRVIASQSQTGTPLTVIICVSTLSSRREQIIQELVGTMKHFHQQATTAPIQQDASLPQDAPPPASASANPQPGAEDPSTPPPQPVVTPSAPPTDATTHQPPEEEDDPLAGRQESSWMHAPTVNPPAYSPPTDAPTVVPPPLPASASDPLQPNPQQPTHSVAGAPPSEENPPDAPQDSTGDSETSIPPLPPPAPPAPDAESKPPQGVRPAAAAVAATPSPQLAPQTETPTQPPVQNPPVSQPPAANATQVPPLPANLPAWPSRSFFEDAIGFPEEGGYTAVAERLRSVITTGSDGRRVLKHPNGADVQLGNFGFITCGQLRKKAAEVSEQLKRVTPHLRGHLQWSNVSGNILHTLADPQNAGATFMVASQVNCLEFVDQQQTPEAGITCYLDDHTQGPACAMACAVATAERNYLITQGASQQINTLAEMQGVLQTVTNAPLGGLTVTNGYAEATKDALQVINRKLYSQDESFFTDVVGVGVHSDVEVTFPSPTGQTVHQIFASAIPVSYSNEPPVLWEGLARVILKGSYTATILHAALRHIQDIQAGRKPPGRGVVYLTRLGGGAFGNESSWIDDAISAVNEEVAGLGLPLDIRIVSFRPPGGAADSFVDSLNKRSLELTPVVVTLQSTTPPSVPLQPPAPTEPTNALPAPAVSTTFPPPPPGGSTVTAYPSQPPPPGSTSTTSHPPQSGLSATTPPTSYPPATASPGQRPSIRVTTINILFQGFYEKFLEQGVVPVPEAQRFAWARKYLDHQAPSTDVFLFQEWSSSAAMELTGHLMRLGFSVSSPVTDQMSRITSCAMAWKNSTLVVSTPPQAFLFEQTMNAGYYSQPSCKQLVIAGFRHTAARDVEVIVGSTHLPFASTPTDRAQILQRLTGPLFGRGNRVAAVLAGDFNADCIGTGLEDGLPVGWQTKSSSAPDTCLGSRGAVRYDHFFCSPEVQCSPATVEPSTAMLLSHTDPYHNPTGEWFSDHAAMSATVEVPQGQFDTLQELVRASVLDLGPLQLRGAHEYYQQPPARGAHGQGHGHYHGGLPGVSGGTLPQTRGAYAGGNNTRGRGGARSSSQPPGQRGPVASGHMPQHQSLAGYNTADTGYSYGHTSSYGTGGQFNSRGSGNVPRGRRRGGGGV